MKILSTYSDQGFEIFAFPCNQFMKQEPGSDADIKKFAEARGVKFPMFSRIEVNGLECHPVYKFLRTTSELWREKGQVAKNIPWNFAKFVINSEGKVVGYFDPKQEPKDCVEMIEKLLEKEE